jgi:hypothetical protein
MKTTYDRLHNQVVEIASTLENGIIVTAEDIEDGYYEEYYEGDIISGYDYLSDALDINYIISSHKEYLGAEVLVAFGGPNIYINTKSMTISGYWGNDRVVVSYYSDAMGIDDALEELYSCN